MKRKILPLLMVCALSLTTLHAAGHTATGTSYCEQGVDTYAQMRHGPDGALFLDPFFLPYLSDVAGQVVLDAGCGAGPWSLVAAQNGAQVWGIDIQEGMIAKANEATLKTHLEEVTHFSVGDVGKLPYINDTFDRAFSINVGCNIPDLKPHFQELFRVLKKGGIVVITAPNAFTTIFTDGSDVAALLQQPLDQKYVQDLDGINRATFTESNGQWTHVNDETQLVPGEKIWRKIPKMVVPNCYHPEEEYLATLTQMNFRIVNVFKPKFDSESDWSLYNSTHNAKLGVEYLHHAPFIIFVAEKL